jgi:hypothetical protein
LFGQSDSIAFGTLGFQLREGIYLDINDLKQNKTISREQIADKNSQQALDYFSQILNNLDTLVIKTKSNRLEKLAVDSIWGFCQNNQIYIQFNRRFFKVPLFGNASTYLIFVQQTTPRAFNPWLSDPYFNNSYSGFGMNNVNTSTVVSIQMLLDFKTGVIEEFSLESLESILKRDETLYKEFSKLKKKNKKKKAIYYLRKYNMLHPIYFPKN